MRLLTLSCLALLAFPVIAQDAPEAVVQEYFNILKDEGFNRIAGVIHPDALEALQADLLPVYRAEEAAGQRQLMDRTFGRSVIFADLPRMDGETFMNGFMNIMESQSGRGRVNYVRTELLGSLIEGGDRHILARVTVLVGTVTVTQMQVVSLRPYGASWKVLPNGEWLGIAAALRANMPVQ